MSALANFFRLKLLISIERNILSKNYSFTHLKSISPLYRNHSIDLQSTSADWLSNEWNISLEKLLFELLQNSMEKNVDLNFLSEINLSETCEKMSKYKTNTTQRVHNENEKYALFKLNYEEIKSVTVGSLK